MRLKLQAQHQDMEMDTQVIGKYYYKDIRR